MTKTNDCGKRLKLGPQARTAICCLPKGHQTPHYDEEAGAAW